jgi:hypothetical protein
MSIAKVSFCSPVLIRIMAKNKGRRHKAGRDQKLTGMLNNKSMIAHLTRPIESMSSKGFGKGRFNKKKWTKRIRGYGKTLAQEKLID